MIEWIMLGYLMLYWKYILIGFVALGLLLGVIHELIGKK